MSTVKQGASKPPVDDVDAIVAQWREQRPDLDPSPIALFGRLHRAYLRYQASLAKVFDQYGLNAATFDALAALRRGGAPYEKNGRELADGTLLSSAGVTLRLDRLEAANWITRERDQTDRRIVWSRLTDKGLDIIDQAIESHLENESAMLECLTKTERADLIRLLGKLERGLAGHADAEA